MVAGLRPDILAVLLANAELYAAADLRASSGDTTKRGMGGFEWRADTMLGEYTSGGSLDARILITTHSSLVRWTSALFFVRHGWWIVSSDSSNDELCRLNSI